LLLEPLPAVVVRGRGKAGEFQPRYSADLSDNCFQCHGPDEHGRKAKLRLDTREGALRVRDDLAAIAPGNSQRARCISASPRSTRTTLDAADKDETDADQRAEGIDSPVGSTRARVGTALGV